MATNNLVVGKGKLYFGKFADPAIRIPGAMDYFGNTPTLTATRTITTLDHYDSDHGIKQKDASVEIETQVNGKFTCDNISSNNLALWFGGSTTPITQASGGSALTETVHALPGKFTQIGVTADNPFGVAGVTGFTATVGGTALVAGTDYTFNPVSGLFMLASSHAAADVALSYTLAASAEELVIETGTAIYGELRYVADNPYGDQRDVYWPYVKLSGESDMALKGDTWQTLSFAFEGLKRDENTPRTLTGARRRVTCHSRIMSSRRRPFRSRASL